MTVCEKKCKLDEVIARVKKEGWSDSQRQSLENAYQDLVEGYWLDGEDKRG